MGEKEDIKRKNAIELSLYASWGYRFRNFVLDLEDCGYTKEEILQCTLDQIAEKANQYKYKLNEINKISEVV